VTLRHIVTPGRLLVLGLVLLVVAVALAILPSNEYIFLPDKAHPVAPLVTVQGGHEPKQGAVYFVDVIVRKATWLERLFGGLHHGATLYPADEVNPPGVSSTLNEEIDLEDMQQSKQIAAAVTLRALGRKVTIRNTGVAVDGVVAGDPADGKLAPDDVITAVDGKPVTTTAQLVAAMSHYKPGDVVRFTVDRVGHTVVESVRTIPEPGARKHPFVGIGIEQATDIQLPVHVAIDTGDIGGPSAGLAFALQVMAEFRPSILHGHTIAATGEIYPDGSVGAIGGIQQKTIGAREAGVQAFLVPVAGDNAKDAEKVAGNLRIIPVKTFPQALRALATLPANR
jgi:Lon-like protease